MSSNDFMFSPRQQVSTSIEEELYGSANEADFVDSFGNHRIKQENKHTLAKKLNKDNVIIYQIKIANNNELFNPYSKLDREKSYSFLDNVVRPTDKFINVNSLVFNYYLKFLKSQNVAWLHKAERERI